MVFLKVLFMWSSMPVFSFIWYTLTELFRKPDNWQQIYKQTSSALYTSNDVSRRKKYYVITWLQNSCWIVLFLKKYRSSYLRCSVRKGVLKNFGSSTGKQLCWSLFLWSCRPPACKFFLQKIPTQVLSCEVCETSKNTYFEEHLQATTCGGVL